MLWNGFIQWTDMGFWQPGQVSPVSSSHIAAGCCLLSQHSKRQVHASIWHKHNTRHQAPLRSLMQLLHCRRGNVTGDIQKDDKHPDGFFLRVRGEGRGKRGCRNLVCAGVGPHILSRTADQIHPSTCHAWQRVPPAD